MADLDGSITRANPAFGRILDAARARCVARTSTASRIPTTAKISKTESDHLVSSDSDGYRLEKRYIHADGRDVWVSINVSRATRTSTRCTSSGRSRTSPRAGPCACSPAFAAIHDSLTTLPNRELFMDRLEVALRRLTRYHQVAVIFLDLDRFKLVNDSLGHDVGDRVLRAVADRLSSVMRSTDTLARFGGDEFTVVRRGRRRRRQRIVYSWKRIAALMRCACR